MSTLVVIDVQERFNVETMFNGAAVLYGCRALVSLHELLNLPILISEQIPAKLGKTRIRSEKAAYVEKSAFATPLPPESKAVTICGIESHICVRLTALAAVAEGRQVTLISDAIGAGAEEDHRVAFEELSNMPSVKILTFEAYAYDLLETAAHPKFKEFLKIIKDWRASPGRLNRRPAF